ncbi:MAG: hypothetical protein ACOC4G_11925 [Bacillota bacterium]
MPLWFRCSNCEKIYYTADTSKKEKENYCEECGAELEVYESLKKIQVENENPNSNVNEEY